MSLKFPCSFHLLTGRIVAVATNSILRARFEDAIRLYHEDIHPDQPAEESFTRTAAQTSYVEIPAPPLTLTSRHSRRSPASSVSSSNTATANATTSIDLYAHDESAPDLRNPPSEARTQCTFAFADYDPSLPLHLSSFATETARSPDWWRTKNFGFTPTGVQGAAREGNGTLRSGRSQDQDQETT